MNKKSIPNNGRNSRTQKCQSLAELLSVPKRIFQSNCMQTPWSKELLDELDKQFRLVLIMRACLPESWHEAVQIGTLINGKWTLRVADGAMAYRLQFLASEIEARLAEKLPYPPKVQVKIDPEMAQMRTVRTTRTKPFIRKHLNNQETDIVLKTWFAEMQAKRIQGTTQKNN